MANATNLGVRLLTGALRLHPFFVKIKEEIIIQDQNNGNRKPNQPKELVNENIRFPQVLLIGPNGEQLGVMSSREAQLMANKYSLDLYCVDPNAKPPVCKIVDYGKLRYERQKKEKENRKKQVKIEVKEIQLTPQIGRHDLETKARAASKFLAEGNKVKVGVRYRGRQMTHLEVGEQVLNDFIQILGDIAIIEKPAAMDGRWLVVILAPNKAGGKNNAKDEKQKGLNEEN